MTNDPFIRDFNPPIGKAEEIAPGLRRLVAPNASPMTFRGTNTYLMGETEIAIIDPGPADQSHLSSILAAVGNPKQISHIFVTHSHIDHSPLARALSQASDAPILALGDSFTGRTELMNSLAKQTSLGGGEGTDVSFEPDILLPDGTITKSREWEIEAITTPGHFSNHLCFGWAETGDVFSGDHVMSWATTLVSPPDGDLSAFMSSLDKMARRTEDRHYFPGHGAVLSDPHSMLAHQTAHRKNREMQILTALNEGPSRPLDLTLRIYTEIPPALIPAAARNVLSHLIDLVGKNLVSVEGELTPDANFMLCR